jgi:hypothetical protein
MRSYQELLAVRCKPRTCKRPHKPSKSTGFFDICRHFGGVFLRYATCYGRLFLTNQIGD